jgi:pectate lyase
MSASKYERMVIAALVATFAVALGACGGGDYGQYAGRNSKPKDSPLVDWPTPRGDQPVDLTIRVRDHFDGGMKRFYGVDELSTSGQEEEQEPLFRLDDNAVIENVILGDPAADGIHCYGSCTLRNVWWEEVGEDAATFRGILDDDVMLVDGGGAASADDKVFQNNRRGTMHIRNFYVEWFGKLYRSCGNCSEQTTRRVIIENVTAVTGPDTECLAGVNVNYGDVAEFRGVNRIYDKFNKPVCLRYQGNSAGLEPKKIGKGPDGEHCEYTDKTVIVQR